MCRIVGHHESMIEVFRSSRFLQDYLIYTVLRTYQASMEANYGSNTVDQLQGTYASSSSGNGQLPGLQLFAVDALTIPRCGGFVSAATVFFNIYRFILYLFSIGFI